MSAFSQNATSNVLMSDAPYPCENVLIEIMFVESSVVRLRGNQPVDLTTNATAGLSQVLSELSWYTWTRFTDVDENLIDQWATDGTVNSGKSVYNLNNIYTLRIPQGHNIWEISSRLETLPGVYRARPYPRPVIPPLPPDYQSNQGYLNSASNNPSGVNALWAWNQTGGTGAGITICDLEYSWNYSHADISKAVGSGLNTWTDPGWGDDHGTAVIGQLVSDNNGWGTTGICYGANLKTCGTYYGTPSPFWNVPGAITIAIANLNAGDIIVLEQQWDYDNNSGFIPIEWWGDYSPNSQTNNGVYAAIVNAITNGIHVVQAGGNGSINTGTLNWYGDSGAIIVGAGGATTSNNLQRLSFSSYGPRFDLQGWGENVTTTGYGDLYGTDGKNYWYTNTFNGTSSASPVVAGALACAQGYYLANISPVPPGPAFMRSHLATYGTAQVFGPSGNIGPRPDIQAAIQNFPLVEDEYDFGDAPDGPYPTLAVNSGPSHIIDGVTFLGYSVDAESDGQPNATATGDDNDGNNDDDGVIFTSALIPGQVATVQVIASVAGVLNAWIDFNQANTWADAGEWIFQDVSLIAGVNNLSFTVPAAAVIGNTFARFRFSTVGNIGFYHHSGPIPIGEVEDYMVYIGEIDNDEYDFGDAPDVPYPTLLTNNGARHLIVPGIYLGSGVDPEPDGQPDPFAMGDDLDGNDDEDGVIFVNSFVSGAVVNIQLSVVGSGFINGWFDWDANGSWADAGDHSIVDSPVSTGVVTYNLTVPAGAVTGMTYARFRFSSTMGLSYAGIADDGEVEDYRILINPPEEHKMHFPQYPDPGGWDVNMTFPHKIGDDWMCSETGYVEDFHFWVSWKGDMVPQDFGVIFEIRIFSDIPADPADPTSYSKPGTLLWERDFAPGMYNYELAFEHPQGWFDPFIPEHQIWDHQNCYRIDIDDFDEPFLQEEGTIYWLVITAHVPGGGGGGTQFITLTLDGIDPFTSAYQTWTEDQAVLSIQDSPIYGTANFTINPQDIILSPGMLVVDLSAYSGTISWVEVDVTESHAPGKVVAALYDAGTVVDIQVSTITGFQTLILTNFGMQYNPDQLTIECLEGIVHEIRFQIQLSGSDEFQIGWKTSLDHYQDVAVWESLNPDVDWEMLHDPVTGELLSLSFIITGSPLPDEELDFGDAPAPYPTLLAQNGARHIIVPGMHLGASIDAEPDGQPDFLAAGDDLNNLQDEDGVKFLNAFVLGETVNIEVTMNGTGYLNAWFDWEANGTWMEPHDHAIVDYAVTTGIYTISLPVPNFAMPGMTYTRFRFSSTAGISYQGLADDGEVEDYRILIQEPAEHKMHYPQYPKSDGYDVEFWSQLADDFMCSTTGPIRFIRFWISHKLNIPTETGSFRIKICEDIPANPDDPLTYSMPGDTLWARTFYPGDYIELPMEHSWQSWLELPMITYWGHYEHYLWTQITLQNIEEPFIQTADEIYWLVIDFGNNKAFKGWKESAEPQFNDTAVYDTVFVANGWGPLYRPHDMQPIDFAFIIDDMIPDNLTLQNITVAGGQTECYEAQNTITTGGSGTTFIVQNNAIVYLIAGYSVNMLPGTHFQSGSQVHAYVDLSGEFCTNPKAIVVEEEPVPEILPLEFDDKESFFRVYPNPNTGQFTLELKEVSEHAVISVEIFSLIGETVMRLELPEMKQYLFDLSARQPGIYLIRVMKGDDVGVEKVIKQ